MVRMVMMVMMDDGGYCENGDDGGDGGDGDDGDGAYEDKEGENDQGLPSSKNADQLDNCDHLDQNVSPHDNIETIL